MIKFKNLLFIVLFASFCLSCKKDKGNNPDIVLDIDGNSYNVVQIGSQFWMKENLKTTKYRDGSLIPTSLTDDIWKGVRYGAFSIYDNNMEYGKQYGYLYNFYAVIDPKCLCPTGWHIPSYTDWIILRDFLGGEDLSGEKLKAVSPLWQNQSIEKDQFGFSALPGGRRYYDGNYINLGTRAQFQSSTPFQGSASTGFLVWVVQIDSNRPQMVLNNLPQGNNGASVRCIKD